MPIWLPGESNLLLRLRPRAFTTLCGAVMEALGWRHLASQLLGPTFSLCVD